MDVGPMERCKIYYKGEGGGFPQVRAVVSLVCPCCPWLILAPKVLQLCTNHFVVEGIHTHSSKSKHSNVITHNTATRIGRVHNHFLP